MDYREFTADRRARPYPERKDAQKEVLEQADDWSRFFENALVERLTNPVDASAVDIDAITDKLSAFQNWCNGPLEDIRKSLHLHDTQRSQELLNYLSFHLMSNLFIQHWFRLLAGTSWDSKMSRNYNSETQDYLAILSVDYQKKLSTQTDANSGMSGSLSGVLSEFDTGIVALQTMKSRPELLLLPAPGRFEHGAIGTRNADFLVLDTEKHEAIGMQVKKYVSAETLEQYDSSYVFLVDTSVDLDDVVSKKIPGRTSPRVLAKPGLIAAHHISNWPKQKDLAASHPWLIDYMGNGERDLMKIKFYANRLTHETKDNSLVARHRIGERTLHHLYKKPVESVAS